MSTMRKVASALFLLIAWSAGSVDAARADRFPVESVTVRVGGKLTSVWTLQGACTPSCVARVISSDSWSATATLAAGRWSMTVYRGHWLKSSYAPTPANCSPDADSTLLTQTWTWDNTTLAGIVEAVRADQCGGPPTVEHAPFLLTRVG